MKKRCIMALSILLCACLAVVGSFAALAQSDEGENNDILQTPMSVELRLDQAEVLAGESLNAGVYIANAPEGLTETTITLQVNTTAFAVPTEQSITTADPVTSAATITAEPEAEVATVELVLTAEDFSLLDSESPAATLNLTSLSVTAPIADETVAGITAVTAGDTTPTFSTDMLTCSITVPDTFVNATVQLKNPVASADAFTAELLKDGESVAEIPFATLAEESDVLTLTSFSTATLAEGTYTLRISGPLYAPTVSAQSFTVPDDTAGGESIDITVDNMIYCDIAGNSGLTEDGAVDIYDFNMVCSAFTSEVDAEDPVSAACDLNGDGEIDADDAQYIINIITDTTAQEGEGDE